MFPYQLPEVAPVPRRAVRVELQLLVAAAETDLRVFGERRVGESACRPRGAVVVHVFLVVDQRRACLDADAQRVSHAPPRAGEELLLGPVEVIELGGERVVVEVVVAEDEIPVRIPDECRHARGVLQTRETLHVAQRGLIDRVLRDLNTVMEVQPQVLADKDVVVQLGPGAEQQRLGVELRVVEVLCVAHADAEPDGVQRAHLPLGVHVHIRTEDEVALAVRFGNADVVIELQPHAGRDIHAYGTEPHELALRRGRRPLPDIRGGGADGRGTHGVLRMDRGTCEAGERERAERSGQTGVLGKVGFQNLTDEKARAVPDACVPTN